MARPKWVEQHLHWDRLNIHSDAMGPVSYVRHKQQREALATVILRERLQSKKGSSRIPREILAMKRPAALHGLALENAKASHLRAVLVDRTDHVRLCRAHGTAAQDYVVDAPHVWAAKEDVTCSQHLVSFPNLQSPKQCCRKYVLPCVCCRPALAAQQGCCTGLAQVISTILAAVTSAFPRNLGVATIARRPVARQPRKHFSSHPDTHNMILRATKCCALGRRIAVYVWHGRGSCIDHWARRPLSRRLRQVKVEL